MALISRHSYPFRYLDQTDNGSKTLDSIVTVNSVEEVDNNSTLESRLKTYSNWPNSQVSSEALAKAGFVYKGYDDIVVCPLCKIEGYNWVSGDDPMADHRVWSPNCSFIRSNIEHDHAESTSRAADTCGLFGVEVLPNSLPEDDRPIDLQRLGVQKGKGPQNQDKITYDSRLATFHNWPRSLKQRPCDLAEAGFYYTGAGDQTLCFYCGGGLKDWEEDDDPWEQHALWFQKCVFLNLKKGKEYVEQVKRNAEPSTSGAQSNQQLLDSDKQRESVKSDDDCVGGGETEATEKTLCKICYKNEVGVVFLPCGHIVACVDCAAALKTCAVCRKPLEATVRAFLS